MMRFKELKIPVEKKKEKKRMIRGTNTNVAVIEGMSKSYTCKVTKHEKNLDEIELQVLFLQRK